jgi:Raf kinase inhibitor-like YbhB/YbcL family protein
LIFQLPHLRYRQLLIILITAAVLALGAIACGGDNNASEQPFDPAFSALGQIDFSSPAFDSGEAIPIEFTCDGEDKSPPLRWSEVPDGTRSLAIILDDPDAPGRIFRHWSVYNIPSGTRSLSAGQQNTQKLKDSTRQGQNEFGRIGYGGPCPPQGQEHEYVFFIYALSEPFEIEDGATPQQVSEELRGRVVATGSFSGMYARQ